MFDNLMESRPRREASVMQSIGSVVVHLLLITVALKLTSGAAETVQNILASPQMSFLKSLPPPPPPLPERPAVRSANQVPPGFQTVVPPRVIPTDIPPVNLRDSFDPKNFTGHGVENGLPTDGTHDATPGTARIPLTDTQVDDPVEPVQCPEPRYPPALKTVGVNGSVTLRYVVGVDGRAEPGSIKVVSSTNTAFEASAIETVGQCVYRPARFKGTVVRQLVEQNVKFTMGG